MFEYTSSIDFTVQYKCKHVKLKHSLKTEVSRTVSKEKQHYKHSGLSNRTPKCTY